MNECRLPVIPKEQKLKGSCQGFLLSRTCMHACRFYVPVLFSSLGTGRQVAVAWPCCAGCWCMAMLRKLVRGHAAMPVPCEGGASHVRLL
jgi:hypothetical protein